MIATTVSGCFTGEYNRRMEETMQQVEQQVLFTQASPIVAASGQQTGMSINMPMFVDSSAKALQSGPDANPPFLQLPGFAYAYEIQINQLPAYVYFAAVPKDQKSGPDLQKELKSTVAKKFSDAAWRDLSVKDANGGARTVKRLSISGAQRFAKQERTGRFDLYLVPGNSHHLLIGWRAPTEVASSINFFETAEQAVGTVQ